MHDVWIDNDYCDYDCCKIFEVVVKGDLMDRTGIIKDIEYRRVDENHDYYRYGLRVM